MPRPTQRFLARMALASALVGMALIGLGTLGLASSRPEPATGYPAPSPLPVAAEIPSAPPSPPVSRPVMTGFPEPDYPRVPGKGDKLGTLTIPRLELVLPIVQGTGDAELKRGVGHYLGSVLPGQDDNCVLSGHRDTVFARLGKLEKGDLLVVRTAAGTYSYAISLIRVVPKDDRTVIVPRDHAVLTVTTCYPFRYVGNAPDRYVLVADLEEAVPAATE